MPLLGTLPLLLTLVSETPLPRVPFTKIFCFGPYSFNAALFSKKFYLDFYKEAEFDSIQP